MPTDREREKLVVAELSRKIEAEMWAADADLAAGRKAHQVDYARYAGIAAKVAEAAFARREAVIIANERNACIAEIITQAQRLRDRHPNERMAEGMARTLDVMAEHLEQTGSDIYEALAAIRARGDDDAT